MKTFIVKVALIGFFTAATLSAAPAIKEGRSLQPTYYSTTICSESTDRYITDDELQGIETVVLHVGDKLKIPSLGWGDSTSSSDNSVIADWGSSVTTKGRTETFIAIATGEAKLTITYSDGTVQQVNINVIE